MMQRLIMMALCSLLWSGCACTKKASSTSVEEEAKTTQKTTTEEKNSLPPEKPMTENPSPCPGKQMTYKGKVTLKGTVGSTKGAQLMLHGVILRIEDRQEARSWIGKNVTATGDLCLYTCGPIEQCLMSGTIKSLKNITIAENPPSP